MGAVGIGFSRLSGELGKIMNFEQAISSGFQNYVSFTGRAQRSAFWYWMLFMVIVSICLSVLDSAVFPQILWSPLSTVFSLAVLLPGIAVTARRLHDIDKFGWWQLLVIIPIIGWIILIIWEVRVGTDGDNRFGPDPLAGASSDTSAG